MSRQPRQRVTRGRSRVGERFEGDVGAIAHGGHCVVRLPEPESRVVFTRHALPGERVVLEITEGTDGDRFWRADAVDVLVPLSDRVVPPCPVAGPGLCGGCDFQHVAVPAQRALKADVVREQLVRLGRLSPSDPLVAGLDVAAVPVPGRPDDGLRWRTRQSYVVLPDGRRGMRKHRSHDVVPVDDCLIAVPGASERPAGVISHDVTVNGVTHTFDVAADGFWQVHPAAPEVLVSTVLDLLSPRSGETTLDLYSGVGLFGRFVVDRTNARLVSIEADRAASAHARNNLPGLPDVAIECGPVVRVLGSQFDEPFDLVVLDPPREGAKRRAVQQVVDRAPRAVAYVACDPAALGRDVAIFAEHGYRVTALRAFDLFPMTHHVECVALLTKDRL